MEAQEAGLAAEPSTGQGRHHGRRRDRGGSGVQPAVVAEMATRINSLTVESAVMHMELAEAPS
jgi:hypothetical protein